MPQRSTQLEETKYSFYDDLQDAVGGVPAGNMLIVAGHWNARPSPVDAATWHILDKLAVGTSWANGDLVNFALANRLVGTSTRFQHTQRGVMVVALTWRLRQPSFEGANATDQTSTASAARTQGPARKMVRQPFSLEWEAPRRLSHPFLYY